MTTNEELTALMAEIRSRTAVPDAATDELARIKPLFENLSREYPSECNKRVKAEAERDASLEAVERIREMHSPVKARYQRTHDGGPEDLCRECGASWPCATAESLDGAPEPEGVWEYQCTNNISTTGLVDDPELHAMQCSGKIERRRKAGPWEVYG